MPYKPPFTIIAGQGLGISYSSLTQIGAIQASEGYGAAAINLYVNVSTGNLVVCDHVLTVMEKNGPLKFGYVYNVQASTPETIWHFAVASRLLKMPETTRPFGTEAILLEVDGHETHYLQRKGQPLYYFAPGHNEGTPYLTYDYEESRWVLYHPGTRVTEYYDSTFGLLLIHRDAKGCETHYEYDQKELTAVVGPSGIRYEIRSKDLSRGIYQVIDDRAVLLQSYLFDELGRLQTTYIPASINLPNGYSITYSYVGYWPLLFEINQSDSTYLSLFYDGHRGSEKVHRIVAGPVSSWSSSTTTTFIYDNPWQVSISPMDGGLTKLHLDDQGRLIKVTKPQGCFTSITEVDETQYAYADTGQVNAITHLGGGIERFVYDDFFGLLKEHQQPDGQLTKFNYDAHFSTKQCTSQNVYLHPNDDTYLSTRFVYDSDHDGSRKHHIALRFIISPEKRVTEHRVDGFGFIISTRCYLANLFTSFATAPILEELEDWVKEQDPQAITLSEFRYDNRGQLTAITRYADIDETGKGINNEQVYEETFLHNDAGNWLSHTVRFLQKEIATEYRSYDGLERIITETDFLGLVTEHVYEEAKHTVTIHNGTQTRVSITQRDGKDMLISEQQTVTEGVLTETRLTQYDSLGSERPIVTNLPDGRRLINFWDMAQNPMLSLSATRLATLTIYNRTHNYQGTIRVSTPVDLGPSPLMPPDCWGFYNDVLAAAKAADTRYSYVFYDLSQRARYSVDPENYCIESMFDAANRLIGTVHYADKITDAELTALKNKLPLTRVIDIMRDRWHSTYFDGDNNIIGEIDPAGWVTETVWDTGGRAIKTTLYHTPVRSPNRSADFTALRPASSAKDAIRYFFYNAKNKVICSVDPNHYVIVTDYYANDLPKRITTYYQKVANEWFNNPTSKPPMPAVHPEDATQDFTYNACGQLLTTEHSNQRKIQRDYDQLGQLIHQSHFDKSTDLSKSVNPDVIRGNRTQWDGWQQRVQQANPYIAQKMLMIEWDPNLTPEQKQTAINALWANESTRNSFDPVTGLLCSVTNSRSVRTLFYYDDERRLVLSVDALGKATEHTYTAFSEIEKTRNYISPIALDKLKDLTGGFISKDVLALLMAKEEDLVDSFSYDRRGTVIKHIDPAGYITEFTPNAFKEIIVEKLPLDHCEPSITITHTFNPLGQEVGTVHSAGDLAIKTSAEFENPHGHVTQQIDATGGTKTFDYDCGGNPVNAIDNGVVVFQDQTFDPQQRVLLSKDAFNAETQHRYTQATRSHRLITPVLGTETITQTNVFNELVKTTDALAHSQTLSHEPDGQVASQQDALGRILKNTHNSEGWLIEQCSASGVNTVFGYNAVGIIHKTVLDSTGNPRITVIDLDGLYRSATVTNPRGVITQNSFDKHGSVIKSQMDTAGVNPLKRFITKNYNAQRLLIEEIHGDSASPDQYHVAYQQDALGRPTSKIIDPSFLLKKENGLNLTTINTLDKVNKVIKHCDQNGATYRLFYDLRGNKRFKVGATGGVQEWRYDVMKRVNFHVWYEQAVIVDDKTRLHALEALVADIADAMQDKVTHYFRDANGDLRFSVKLMCQLKVGQSTRMLQGILTEHQYDHVRRESMQCLYAKSIDVDAIATFTTQSIAALVVTIKNTAQDRVLYKFYNAAGDCCFSINAMGKLHEDRFDAEKRITRAIDYATPIVAIDTWLTLPFEDFKANVKTLANSLHDQYQCYGFDAFSKPLYTVKANGAVIRFKHDESDNLIEEIHFDAPLISVPDDDAALKAAVMALKESPLIDRMKRFTYDTLDGQVKIIDQLGNEDVFERDALNNIKRHQNREGQATVFEYDRAKRQILSTAPAKAITSVALTPDGKLNPSTVVRSVKTKREYDNNNNLITLIADVEGDQPRYVKNTYTPNNRLATLTVPNATVDDPSQPASLNPSQWPVVKTDLVKSARYNAKGLLIVEIDEGNHYRFKVYDNLNRLRFAIAQESAATDAILCSVTGYEYNAFGDKVWETHYATFISVDIARSKEKGLKLSDVAGQLNNTLQDQVKWYDYNKNSEWTHRVTGITRNPDDSKNPSSFYYNPVTQDIGTHYRLMRRTLTIFGQPELISTLISPNPETWQHQRIVYDRCNKPIVEAVTQRAQLTENPGFHVKVTKRNAHQEIVQTNDFYTLCSLPLNDLNVPYDAVIHFYQNPANRKIGFDKIKTYTYTLQGKKASRTLKNVTWASLELSDPKNPSFKNQLTDAVEHFSYSAIEKLITHQLANAASEYHFRNAAGELIAHVAQPRQLSSGSSAMLFPLKVIGLNAHGQAMSECRYVNGATIQGNIPTATPLQTSPDDQSTIKFMDDARGLICAEQNARGIVKASSFTATQQKAREWSALTNRIIPKTLVCETAFLIDARGRTQAKLLKEDNLLIQASYKQFSPFGDEILAGPNNTHWPLYRKQDNSGRTWQTNENKAPTVLLHDLRANVTAEIVAQQTDVKALSYEQVIPLIKNDPPIDYHDIEITLSLRDENSRILQTVLPRSAPSLTPSIKNIPLQVSATHVPSTHVSSTHVSSAHVSSALVPSTTEPATLFWVIPPTSNVTMAFRCWTDPLMIHRLPIELVNDRCTVDVSVLVTNIYNYRIDYSLKSPVASSQNANAPVLYQTTGMVGIITATQNGQQVVASVIDDHVLYLAGVNDLSKVTVRQALQTIATFPLKEDKGHYYADLVTLASGSYTAQAVTKAGVELSLSLPFIINTALAPKIPLAREIPAISQLMTFNQYGQLTLWESLPKDYRSSKVSVRINYLDQADALQEEQFVIDPTQPTTPVKDPAGHAILANIRFKAAVKEIKDCDIQLIVGEVIHDGVIHDQVIHDTVMLYKDVVPTGSQATEVTHVLHGRGGRVESTRVLTHVGRYQAMSQADGFELAQSPEEAKEAWHEVKRAVSPVHHQLLEPGDEITDVGPDLDPTLVITWSCEPVRIAWIRGLTQTFSTPPTISYLDVSFDHLASWKEKVALSVTTLGIVIDVTGFPAGNYPYIFEGGDKANPLILSLTAGKNLYSSVDQSLQPPNPLLRHIDYSRDVRGNIIRETQASGALFDRSFSLDNQLLSELGPVISVQDANGVINEGFRPRTQRLYDIRGLFFGTQMPAGNLDAYLLNSAGDKLQHVLGDGTVEARYRLDGFGRRLSRTLANNAVFSYQYNQSNKLIQSIIPNDDVSRNAGKPLVHEFFYNEYDVQDQHLDAAGSVWQIDLDSRNNTLRIKEPTGVMTIFTYGRDNFLLSCKNPLYTLTWLPDAEREYFGVIGQHIDGSGCRITYLHNQKGEVIAKYGVGGQHGNMTQLREMTVRKKVKPKHKHHHARYVLCDVFIPITAKTPPVHSEFRYVAGRLMTVKDNAQKITTEYSYDAGDRPSLVTLRGFDGTIIHAASAIYNQLGDETQIYNDSLLNALITYDENRNVRRKLFDVKDQGRKLTSTMDHGFTYDRADRALLVDGAFTPQGVVLKPSKGFETTYVNHQRVSESRIRDNGSREVFDYTYWQSGELRSAQLRNTNLVSQYYYHPSGYQCLRQGSHQYARQFYLKNFSKITANAALFQTREYDYTAIGHFYEEVITSLTPAADGRTILKQTTADNNSQSNFSYGYQYNHVNFDSPQTTGVNGWTDTRDGKRAVSSRITHDSHGTVNGKWDVSDDKPSGKSEEPRLIWYINGEEGTTYQKWYLYPEHRFKRHELVSLFGIKNVYFYTPRGAYLGSYQNHLPSTLGAGTVSANLHYHMPTANGNLAQFFNNKADRSGRSRPGGKLTMAENIGRMMSLKTRVASYHFKNHRQRIDEDWPYQDMIMGDGLSPVPQVVTVKTGDTYDLMAQNIYGTMADASVSLAESAGDTAEVVPQVGSQVITPQFIPQTNKSTDQMPLSLVQQYIQGTLLPHLEFAQPSQKKGQCTETIVRVVIDIIAVAIAVCTCGGASSVSVAMIEAAAVAAASDAAMQEVAINVGLLQSFSWQEVITTGIAGAMTAGFSAPAGEGGVDGAGGAAANFAPEFFSQFGTFARLIQLMVFAGTVNIMDQLALIAVGKRQGFDVKELLVTIVEAGIALGVGKIASIDNSPQLSRALTEVTDDVINTFVGSAIMGGSADIETAMAQAIGATIGNSIGDHVNTANQTATEVNSSEATHIGAAKAMTNMGPQSDSSYYRAKAAATGVSTNASATPASDLASDLNDLLFHGLDADAHDFAISVISNSHKPVTSVNQNSVRPSARLTANAPSTFATPANATRMKQLFMGADIANPAGTIPVNPAAKSLPSIGVLGTALNNFVSAINPLIVVPQYISEARQDFNNGNVLAGINALSGALLSAATVIPFGGGLAVNDARATAAYLSSKVGIFSERSINLAQPLNPNEVRFSQQSVSYLKNRLGQEPYTLSDITHSMANEGWQGRSIDVVKMPEGGYTSLDNTRVIAARRSGIDLNVNIHKYNEHLPSNMAKRFEHPAIPDAYAKTWGEALEYRIIRQNLNFQHQYFPLGSYEEPSVTYPKHMPKIN